MLDKLIVLYLFTITLNPAMKLNVEADIKPNAASVPQSTKTMVRNSETLDEDTWQPIIQKHTKMAMPTASWQNLEKNKRKHGDYIKKQTHQNYTFKHYPQHNRYGNYSKRPVRTSTATIPSSAFSSAAIKNIKLRTHMSPTYNKNNKINNTSRAEGKNQFIPHHQYQQQQLVYSLNNIKTLSPQLQIPKDKASHVQEYHYARNKKNLISSQLNSQYLADVTEHKKTFPSTTDWHQVETQHVVSLTPKIDTTNSSNSNVKTNTMKTDSENSMANVKNSTDTIVTKKLNSFVNNKKSIDNEITNTKKQQLHNHQHYTTAQYNGIKSFTTTISTKESPTEAVTKSNAAERNEVAEKNSNVELFLAKTLTNAQIFYDTLKDIILSDNLNIINDDDYDDDDSNDDDEEDDNTYKYSNEDKINGDNNDLQILHSSSHQLVKDTPTTVAEAVAAALGKMDLLDMKNMLLTSALIGEVQGRQHRSDEGKSKYSTTAASTSSLTSFQKHSSRPQNEADKAAYQLTPSNATQARHNGQLWNLSTNAKTMSASSTSKTHATSSLTTPTSKSFSTLSSGRKVKKLKKKFQKYLLPLLLAYKLKFLTLLPLLIGGLTLLVGTGGMAGFFFALFAAVMSLKSHSRNAIIVKKY